jgi:hypothetical protein
MQEVMIETFPGNYDEIIKRLKADSISEVTREGTYLTIRTEHPEQVMSKLLTILARLNESLLDLKLIKPNLDNVFVNISKKKQVQE